MTQTPLSLIHRGSHEACERGRMPRGLGLLGNATVLANAAALGKARSTR